MCLTASFLATGSFVKLFKKKSMIFHEYSGSFKFHEFSMHGTFLCDFVRISRACGNPAHINFLRAESFFMLLLSSTNIISGACSECQSDPDQNQLSADPDLDPICL